MTLRQVRSLSYINLININYNFKFQGIAILLSCLVYQHHIRAIGIIGIIVVFAAVFLRVYCKQRLQRLRTLRMRLESLSSRSAVWTYSICKVLVNSYRKRCMFNDSITCVHTYIDLFCKRNNLHFRYTDIFCWIFIKRYIEAFHVYVIYSKLN